MYEANVYASFNWEAGSDAFVDYALENNMEVVGHTLVWHHQMPAWFFSDSDGNQLSRDALIERMRHHIHTIVGRYKGKIRFWDVVNEAVDIEFILKEEQRPNSSGVIKKRRAVLRKSKWLEIIAKITLNSLIDLLMKPIPKLSSFTMIIL